MKGYPLKMKHWARWSSALVLAGWIGTTGVWAEELTVVKGATAQVTVPEGIKNVIVQKKEIVDARPAADGKTLTVAGLAEGTSDLRIERMQGAELLYKVTVRADLQKMIDEIRELLTDVEGVEIKAVGSKVWLRGNVATKTGYDMVEKVAEAYGGTVINGTKLDRSTTGKILCRLILDDIGSDTITARLVEDTVILEGVVYSQADAERAVQLAQRRNPKVLNLMSVQQAIIETDVKFIQVATDNNTDFGFNVLDSMNIQAQGGLQGGNTGKPSLTYGVTGTASAKINALLGANRAKLLNEENVSANSGEEGQTQVGGVSYIPIAGNVGGTVEKVPFGVILKVKPVLQGKDSVVSTVTVEVSSPLASGPGGFAQEKSATSTTVRCKIGESIFLSGLVQVLGNHLNSKTPLLGDIPLVNLFFSQKVSDKQRKEVLMVLTPRVQLPEAARGPAGTEQLKHLSQETPASALK